MPPTPKSEGTGSVQPEGMSRAEASRARLAAQRERLAQQRARLSASGTKASSIQRCESGASVQSTLSSIIEQPAQQERAMQIPRLPISPKPAASSTQERSSEPFRKQAIELLPRPTTMLAPERLSGCSEDDRGPTGLQGRSSGVSDGSRGSGLLSPGGLRSRSAAIDVPTSPNRLRRSPRYTPYEEDPYLQLMGAPPAADRVSAPIYPVPAAPGPGKAGHDQPELSPVSEVIDTGFASIDSKQKASQLFNIPARLSEDSNEGAQIADRSTAEARLNSLDSTQKASQLFNMQARLSEASDESTQAAGRPAAEAPRRKKKEEGKMPPRVKLTAGKQGAEQAAPAPSILPRPVASPQPIAAFSGMDSSPSGAQQQAPPFGSSLATGNEATASEQTTGPFHDAPVPCFQLPDHHTFVRTLLPPKGASAALESDQAPAPMMPEQKSADAASIRPHFPAFGSLIPPAPEDCFWQSAPAAGSEQLPTETEAARDCIVPNPQLQGLATDMPISAPAGNAADTDFWASAGEQGEATSHQTELLLMHQTPYIEQQNEGAQQHQQPAEHIDMPDAPSSNAAAGSSTCERHGLDDSFRPMSDSNPVGLDESLRPTPDSRQSSSPHAQHQASSEPLPGDAHAASVSQIPSDDRHANPELALRNMADASHSKDSSAHPQSALEQPAPVFAQAVYPFGAADVSYQSPSEQCASLFPSGQDDDTSFFEGLGGPGHGEEPLSEPIQAPSDTPALHPDQSSGGHPWHHESQQSAQGQPWAEQVQYETYAAEGQQQQSQWDILQHPASNGQQQAAEAPLQHDTPFGHHAGQRGSYGQAKTDSSPFSSAAASEQSQKPQAAGVLQTPAWPSQAPSEVPREDLYARGGQNYYGAGWQTGAQANAPENVQPAKESSPGWGKLGFWGRSHAAEKPAEPAQDQGVLYYGTQEASAGPPPPPSVYTSQQPAQSSYGGFSDVPRAPTAHPQEAMAPFAPLPAAFSSSTISAPPPSGRVGMQPPPVQAHFGHPPAAQSTQPGYTVPQPAQNLGSSAAPLVQGQQAPWHSSVQSSSVPPQATQQAPPWLQGRPASSSQSTQSSYGPAQAAQQALPWQLGRHPGSAQSSNGQPQTAGNEQLWHGSASVGDALQHQQEAAQGESWQCRSASASPFPPANDQQHAEVASGSAAEWGPEGPGRAADASSALSLEPQQPVHLDDARQAPSQPYLAAEAHAGQGMQAGHPDSSAIGVGPFGAADASEADFWGQHDAEGLSEGPFGFASVQQSSMADRTRMPEQGDASMPADWGTLGTEHEQSVHDQTAHPMAEAPCRNDDTFPFSEAGPHGNVPTSQELSAFGEALNMTASAVGKQDDVQLHSAMVNTAATERAATPFGSEVAQNWQTAGSDPLPPFRQPPPKTVLQGQPGSLEGPQNWMPDQHWSGANSHREPYQHPEHDRGQVHELMAEQQAIEQPQGLQGDQAWAEPYAPHHHEAHDPEMRGPEHGIGQANAAQLGGNLEPGHYPSASQELLASWQGYPPANPPHHSAHASAHQTSNLAWQGPQAGGNEGYAGSYAQQQSTAQNSMAQQGASMYMPPATAAPGALFKGGQNAWTAQQKRLPSSADAGFIPGSAEEALRVTHGRPPCALVSFGIGGRVIVQKPVLAHGHGSKPVYGNALGLDSRWLPGQLCIARMGGLAACLDSSPNVVQASSTDDADYPLQQFPGPLTSATPREKVIAFLEEQAGACELMQSSTASTERAMWQVLCILASNAGSLRGQGRLTKGKPDEGLETELAAALAPAASSSPSMMPAWQAHGSSMAPYQGSGNGHAVAYPGAADTVQKLLLEGKRAEALRAAVECALWGPALILARASGEKAYAETAAAVAEATAGLGSPLSAVLLMLAGGHDVLLPAKPLANSSPSKAASGSSFNLKGLLNTSASKADVSEVGSLEQAEPSAAELAMLANWRSNLAALASYMASPADEALIVRLGDRLWEQQGQVEAAHLCYLVGGVLPQVYEPLARMCLLGADHRTAPHSLASVSALQRTEVLEWVKLPGMAQPAQLALPLLPYKLLYAYKLAEYGHLTQALQYLGLVRASLGSLGNKMPTALLLCNGMAADLEQRLRAHAAASSSFQFAFNVSVKASQSSSFIGGLGRLLDKGINRLISGDLPASGPASTGSDTDPTGRQIGRNPESGSPMHRRSSSLQHNGGITPVASLKDLASASQQTFAQGKTGQHQSRPGGSPSKQALGRQAVAAQQAPVASGAGHAGAATSGPPSSGPSSIRSMFSGLGGLLGAASLGPPKKEAKLGAEENTFFYDEERKMWRERGAEIPAAAAPLPPPPSARPPGTSAPSTGPPPPAGQTGPPPMRQQETRGASSRYVNTMSSSNANRTSSTMLPPLVPPAPSAAAKPPSSFFMPAHTAQRPVPISSPVQQLASQSFNTGTPATILAEESPVRDNPQEALQKTSQPAQNTMEQPACQFQPGEGRRSSGFGQWLSNGIKPLESPAESQAGALSSEAPPGSAAQLDNWQGSQLYGEGAQQHHWGLKPSQLSVRHGAVGTDAFTAYAPGVEPAQQTGALAWQNPSSMPARGMTAQSVTFQSIPGSCFPAEAGAPAIDSEEMKEIEL